MNAEPINEQLNPADVLVEIIYTQRSGFSPVVGTGVRLTHILTGTVVEEVGERSAHANKAKAWDKLQSVLDVRAAAKQEDKQALDTSKEVALDHRWAEYLKDGETPFDRFIRERKDLSALLGMYANAVHEVERLNAIIDNRTPEIDLYKLAWEDLLQAIANSPRYPKEYPFHLGDVISDIKEWLANPK